MQLLEKCAEIQAILFACGESIELSRIAQAVDLPEDEVKVLIRNINGVYIEGGLPFEIAELSGSAQLCTLPKYAEPIRAALTLRRDTPLSQAAFEVLAIIAYNQPVTKAFVEQVRGVDSSGVINSLAEKALIEEAGRLELPGRPISYQTTTNFLRCFSLSELSDLPQVEDEEETQEQSGEETVEMEGQLGFDEI